MTEPVLRVSGLCVDYVLRQPRRIRRAVGDITFSVAPGEIVALVGESGSGKTTIARAVLGQVRPASGSVVVAGRDVHATRARDRASLAADLQAVFQDPFGSLNPSLSVGRSLAEPLLAQGRLSRSEIDERVATLLRRVGLPGETVRRFPAQFSGGQRQRIAIARALSVQPAVVVCDEPTSALDVSTQQQVLELLGELRDEHDLAYLFISHDLAVVRSFADRVLVLNDGSIVEEGAATEVCDHPQHPYTARLVAAAPVPDPVVQRRRRAARLLATTD